MDATIFPGNVESAVRSLARHKQSFRGDSSHGPPAKDCSTARTPQLERKKPSILGRSPGVALTAIMMAALIVTATTSVDRTVAVNDERLPVFSWRRRNRPSSYERRSRPKALASRCPGRHSHAASRCACSRPDARNVGSTGSPRAAGSRCRENASPIERRRSGQTPIDPAAGAWMLTSIAFRKCCPQCALSRENASVGIAFPGEGRCRGAAPHSRRRGGRAVAFKPVEGIYNMIRTFPFHLPELDGLVAFAVCFECAERLAAATAVNRRAGLLCES